jgi:hypothetical protein
VGTSEVGVVIRPSLKNARFRPPGLRWLFGGVPVLGLATAMFVKSTSHDSSFFWLGGGLIAALLALVALAAAAGEWLVARNMTIFVEGGTIGMTTLLGKPRTWLLDNLRRVELTSRTRSVGPGRTIAVAATRFVSAEGNTIFEIRGREFSEGDLRRLCAEAHVPLVGSWESNPASSET